MKKVMIVASLALSLSAGAAGASHSPKASDQSISRRDPIGDVGNRLDLVRVAFRGHGDGTATLALRTERRWRCRYISRDLIHDGGTASLRWMVNTDRDHNDEKTGFFSCDKEGFSIRLGKRTYEARRANLRSIAFTLPLEKLGLDDNKHLSFRAASFANGKFGEHVYVEETDISPALAPLEYR